MPRLFARLARWLLTVAVGRRNFEYRFHRRSRYLRRALAGRAVGEAVDDSQLVSRIIASYRSFSHEVFGESMWSDFYNSLHTDLHAALMHGSAGSVAALLQNPASSDLFYGFENLSKSLLAAPRLEDINDPAQALDSLLCFAEAMDVIRLENPESYGLRGPRPIPDADEILDAIEHRLGVELPIPNPYPKEYGLQTRRGILSYRAAQAMYQAWRICELVAGIDNPRVVEIGGGLGRTAFYARVMGIRRYTIVDVPISIVAQSYFLGRTLGETSFAISPERGDFCLQLPQDFFSDHTTFDLALNVDSLTELDLYVAEQYINSLSERAKTLLSINHESNGFTVANLTRKYRRTRSPCWTRRGYTEELVFFS